MMKSLEMPMEEASEGWEMRGVGMKSLREAWKVAMSPGEAKSFARKLCWGMREILSADFPT